MKSSRLLLSGIAASMLAIAGCQRDKTPEPFTPTGKLFVFNYRLSYATYMLTFARTAPVPEGATVHAEFENPMGGAPLTLDRRVFPAQDKLVLESPDVLCVKKDRPYKAVMVVTGPDGATLQRFETTIISSLDQSVLPARPMVVGPAYDKNPEVFEPGQKPDLAGRADCPG